MPVTQVALAAGFASVRRFNDAFKASCGSAPSAIRRRSVPQLPGELILRLGYRPPFDFSATLAALRERGIPGVEHVTSERYERSVGCDPLPCWIRIISRPDKPELLLHAFGVQPKDVQGLVRRVRRMFDLDADMHSVHAALRIDPRLAGSLHRRPGLRLVGGWDGFEVAIGEILRIGERNEADVSEMLGRCVRRWGPALVGAPAGLPRCFPTPACLAAVCFESDVGLQTGSAHVIRRLAHAVDAGALDFGPGQALEEFVIRFVALTGAAAACAEAVALHALNDPDAFPTENLPIGARLAEAFRAASPSWRPWRAYALLHLSDGKAEAAPAAASRSAANP